MVVLAVLLGVWLVGFRDTGAAPVLPDTTARFSLDLEVVADTEHDDVVYAVEQRARPFYRIFSFDPASGEVETVLTIEEDAIVFDIAIGPAGDTLAVGWASDHAIEGSGVSLLDLATGQLDEVVPASTGTYLTDLTWSPDGESVLATEVDRTGAAEQLSAVRVDLGTASVSTLLVDAVNPVQLGQDVYALPLDEDGARRTVAVVDAGVATVLPVDTGEDDLDHLLADAETNSLRVAVIDTIEEATVTIGDAASAHGNHDTPSTWWAIPLDVPEAAEPLPWEPTIVYDSAVTADGVVYATVEGISVGADDRLDLIESRAIRFVTA